MAQAQQSPVELLAEVKDQLSALKGLLEKNFENTFTQQFIRQKLQEASTGIEQELRNIKIDAEIAQKRAEGLIK